MYCNMIMKINDDQQIYNKIKLQDENFSDTSFRQTEEPVHK